MYCIYRVTNNINGHTYIGQHFYGDKANPLQKSTSVRGLYKGSGKILMLAYKKYGRTNFSIKVLHDKIESLDMTNKLERYWISYERLCGHAEYNIMDGGQGACCRGYLFSEQVKEGMKRSGAAEKISMSMTGVKNPRYGKPALNRGITATDEAREKNRLAHLGKKQTEETKRKQSEWMKAHPNSGQFKKGHVNNNKGKVYYKDPSSMECGMFFEGQQPSGWIRGRYTPWQGNS